MIGFSWKHLEYLEQTILDVETRIEQSLIPYRKEIELLDSIPGVNKTAAAVIIAELGTDMSVFPTENHVSSWAGVSPGNNESAGKKKRTGATPGNKALKSVLCECGWAASNTKNTRLSATYWRWVKRMGKKKALFALGHLLLKIAYKLLLTKQPYKEMGTDYLAERDREKEQRLIRQLQLKGYQVTKV